MPVYEYECTQCGHRFAKLCRMDAPNPSCPKTDDTDKPCGGKTRKLVSKSTFHLKPGGCGWADTGYS